jgi:hypothetical protein
MPITEIQALALIRSGTSVTELVRKHGADLEVHMDFGRGLIAAARLDLVEDPVTGETNVRATADVVDRGRKVKATLESSVSDAEDWLQEAIDKTYGKLALAAAANFISGRGGSRKMVFARRFGPAPAHVGVGSAKALAEKNEIIAETEEAEETEQGLSRSATRHGSSGPCAELDEFRRDPINTDDTPIHERKWRR